MSDAGAGTPPADVARALVELRGRIERACARAGRDASEISVLAVTKGFGAEAIEAAINANIADIGENYVQEAQAKFARVAWPPRVRRHFIGAVQRNKARKIAALFDVVQTVDSAAVATALERAAADADKTLDVLIQVNVSDDARNGIAPDACAELARTLDDLPHLKLRGVMAVGPLDAARSAAAFAQAAGAYRGLARDRAGITTLSLGMSGDLDAAIAAGSTMVRIGTALFGPRPTKGKG